MAPSQPGSSFGSGNALLGAPASQVLAQPGMQQQSPSSAGFTPGLTPPPPSSMPPPQMGQMPGAAPDPNAMPQNPQMPMNPQQPQGVVGLPQTPTEAQSIIDAMGSRLKSLSKAQELQNTQGA